MIFFSFHVRQNNSVYLQLIYDDKQDLLLLHINVKYIIYTKPQKLSNLLKKKLSKTVN